LKQLLIYRHPFPPLSPHFFICSSSTQYPYKLLLGKKIWRGEVGICPPMDLISGGIFNILIIKKIKTHITVLFVNHGVTFLKTLIDKID
jgi:hypothetical protein